MAVLERELERIFKSVANRRRLSTLKFLKDGREESVTTIAEKLKLSVKATSKHLHMLAGAGFLDRRQDGAIGLYSISKDITDIHRKILGVL